MEGILADTGGRVARVAWRDVRTDRRNRDRWTDVLLQHENVVQTGRETKINEWYANKDSL